MYLKSLDIQGFKSFPDKLHLDFHEGMTAIVGPNGSGKSNIADAIRWVLGEQSTKTLRGSKMEDVIFAGTKTRKAVGYAEVSLTLDNSAHTLKTDYTEVVVTRRYYRSGQSEYFLNKKTVRLKDIHELFMDTGLGRDGYSIIGQGRIDEILAVRSDDRREVFDEAAGITKYRYRRDEAMKRLDAANENLLRVNDIIQTLEEQLEPMRIRAEKEKTYNTLFGELKGLEISLWMLRLDELKADCDKLTGEKNIVSYDAEACKLQIETAYSENERLMEEMISLDRNQDELRARIREMEGEHASVVSQIGLKKAEIDRNVRETERLRDEAADYEQRKDALLASIDEQTASIQSLEERAVLLRSEIAAYEQQTSAMVLQHTEQSGRLHAVKEQAASLGQKLAVCRIERSSAEASREALVGQLAEIGKKDETDRRSLEEANEKIEMLDRMFAEKQQSKTGLLNIAGGYRLKIESRQKKYDAARSRCDELSKSLQEAVSRHKILTDLERDYEGFNRAVKFVMRDAEHQVLKGIHGPVSKLVKVDERYVVAAETALGAGMQNIVCAREEDAKAAIEMLKRRDGGRATFLPISAVKGTELDDRTLRGERGYVGVLSQLVSYDAVYDGIFKNLLGRTAVCESLDAAISLARKNGYKFRIVTLDGQIINAGGAMTGGSQNRSAGILSRTNEIERLSGEIEALQTKYNTDAASLRGLEQELNAAQYSLTTAENERQALETELAALEAQLTERRETYRLMEASLRDADAVRNELSGRIHAFDDTLAAIRKRESLLEDEAASVQTSADSVEQTIQMLMQRQNELQATLSERRIKLQECDLAIGAAKSAVEERKVRLDSIDTDKTTRLAATDAYERQNRVLTDEIAVLEETAKRFASEIADLNVRSGELSEKKLRVEAKRIQNDKTVQELSQKSLNLERELVRLESRIEDITRDQDSLTTKLWDNYELTRSTAKDVCIPIDDRKTAQKRSDELRRSIKALGNIYPGAIEEYAQASEKYKFLTEQREDIEVSQKSLITIIDDLTAEMKTLFSKQFAVINRIFGETFTELFGGGQAHLELSDPSDVLGSGIEIKVQPPGKALKVLSLLSGGEKAFVAIALYFAILKVRPTPFCVLDEIEAALDDVNVARYAKYLKQYTDTQFIVITHRRGTMEEADVLYGVAMPVQGVSRVLSLDVASVERELNMKL